MINFNIQEVLVKRTCIFCEGMVCRDYDRKGHHKEWIHFKEFVNEIKKQIENNK